MDDLRDASVGSRVGAPHDQPVRLRLHQHPPATFDDRGKTLARGHCQYAELRGLIAGRREYQGAEEISIAPSRLTALTAEH